ncbi:lysophospholipid acyltransferase family protein [Hymenobacter caeli]|uniref:1-acyl-sn-glycerol-3-phosphate acyltransferase n=1 Tax=Hymenobacter caeli TaxID=2735894 RepID=A0ABX2FNV8_9BACT|nr:lysophospholipid acyltransferase family protein [Hymenobacter caeli]NRT18835.1 1-acyl-sn-glycerol-3-phosphate acyltransferase [Hymenobacter caeli]
MLAYHVMKPIVQVALRVFFRRAEVRHRDRLALPGPLLLAVNHPNTLMDPLLVAAHMPRPAAFLAKSTFFKNPVSKAVFEAVNCLPIYRRQDAEAAATAGGQALNAAQLHAQNEAAFGKCYDYLGQGRAIMIFPEGISLNERTLRPLKTGAARIALGAEARHDFQLGLHVLPVGLNYFDPTRFRSDVLLNVAPPIRVAAYAAAYAADPDAAAAALTAAIQEALEWQLVVSHDAAGDALAQQIEHTFGDHLNPDDDPDTLYDNFQLSRTLLQAVAYFARHDPARLAAARPRLAHYLGALHRHGLDDAALDAQRRGRLAGLLNLALGLPVWAYGLVNNYLPYKLPALVARRATPTEPEFRAAVLMGVGLVVFPLCYALQAAAVQHWLAHRWWLTALYVLSLPVSGFYALGYGAELAARLRRLRALRLFRRAPAEGAALLAQRAALLADLEDARAQYLAQA